MTTPTAIIHNDCIYGLGVDRDEAIFDATNAHPDLDVGTCEFVSLDAATFERLSETAFVDTFSARAILAGPVVECRSSERKEPSAHAPCCTTCPGFGIFNAPDASPDGVTGGEVQACDECGAYDDAEAIAIVRAFGCAVDETGLVIDVPPRALHMLRLLAPFTSLPCDDGSAPRADSFDSEDDIDHVGDDFSEIPSDA